MPEPDVVLVRVPRLLFDTWSARTNSGRLVKVELGQPDAEGIYSPTFTTIDDGRRTVTEQEAVAAVSQAVSALFATK